MKLQKQDAGIWVSCKGGLPVNWEKQILRYADDHYPVDNDLFEQEEGGLRKAGGTGFLPNEEIEWLKPVKDVYVLTEDELIDIIKYLA